MSNQTRSPIREALKSRDPVRCNQTEAMISNVIPLLLRSLSTFPGGTSHTSDHTSKVEIIAGMLLSADLIRQLQDEEIQLLLLACHFHDLGMAGTEYENQTKERQEQARRDHAIRIGKIILDRWKELGFPNKELAQLLAEVCRGHRPVRSEGRAHWAELEQNAIIAPGQTVRLRMLSALIYAADELHLGSDRAPQREEDWIQLKDQNSLMHWRRHQRIAGPAVINGLITFQVDPNTGVVEKDLRRQVFRKALSAVNDARSQLEIDGIVGSFPPICVKWKRDAIWKLMILHIQSDHRRRSLSELEETISELFLAELTKFEGLNDLCTEIGNDPESIAAAIRQSLKDLETSGQLVPEPHSSGNFQLNTDEREAREFFRLAREADEDEVLFGGSFAAHHEFDLQKSDYGKAYADKSMIPIVEAGFGVNLAVESAESAILCVLRSSPTASRMLTNFTPAPSLLVKRHLLRSTVLNGASLDLFRSPDLVLDPAFRSAYRELYKQVADGQINFLRFVEERALVGGFSDEQLQDALVPSASAMKDFETSAKANPDATLTSTTLHLSQQVPMNLPATTVSFGHLLLAGSRAGVQVEMIYTSEAPFQISVEGSQSPTIDEAQLSRISIGPGKPTFAGRVDMRATFTFDSGSKVGEFLLRKSDDEGRDGLPFIVGMPIAAIMAGGGEATTHFGLYTPALTVGLVNVLQTMCEIANSEEIECHLVLAEGHQRLATQSFGNKEAEFFMLREFDKEAIRFLTSVSIDTPVPWGISSMELAELANPTSTQRSAIYEKYVAMGHDAKHKVTTITLRCATADGLDLRDRFLGFFPSITFRPPTVDEKSSLSQQEVDRLWNDPVERITSGCWFSTDYQQLSDDICKWVEDPTNPFPVTVIPGPPISPIMKSAFEIIICPHIARLWYIERPMIMRVRPLQQLEQWEVEAKYWESVGDQNRASLLKERIGELQAINSVDSEF